MKKLLKTGLALSIISKLWSPIASTQAQEFTPSQLIQTSYESHLSQNFETLESGIFSLYGGIDITGLPNLHYQFNGSLDGGFNINIPQGYLVFEGDLSGSIKTLPMEDGEESFELDPVHHTANIYLHLFDNWLYVDDGQDKTKQFVGRAVDDFFLSLNESMAALDEASLITDSDQAFLDTYFEVFDSDDSYVIWPNYEEAIDPHEMWADLRQTSFYAGLEEGLDQAYDSLDSDIDLSREEFKSLAQNLLETFFFQLSDIYMAYDKETILLNDASIMFEMDGDTVFEFIDILEASGIQFIHSEDERADFEGTLEDLLIEIDLGTGLWEVNKVNTLEDPWDADEYIEVGVEE